jgi:hypothetical protein
MAYRNVSYVGNGWSNYNIPGPLGNQFATPFGDPYRVQGTSGLIGDIFSGIGKIGSALLPAAAPIGAAAVTSLLTKSPQAPATATQQSQFTDAARVADAQAQAAAAQRSNQMVYIAVGGIALVALFYFMSRRK